jgi:hypothetical protein
MRYPTLTPLQLRKSGYGATDNYGNSLISQVTASNGQSAAYAYQWVTYPSQGYNITHTVLKTVTYGDGTQSHYTYKSAGHGANLASGATVYKIDAKKLG